jgi:histidinol-phosphate aminotransferase
MEFSEPGDYHFLDANENNFGSAIENTMYKDLRLAFYPDPYQQELKDMICAKKREDGYEVTKDKLYLSNGLDEAIDALIRIFAEPGQEEVIITPPTFGMYKVAAQANNVGVVESPLDEDFDLDMADLDTKIKDQTKLVFACSPNNPTGNLLSEEKITQLLEREDVIVIVDETYIPFSQSRGFLDKLDTYPNLVVLDGFSKPWGMAGVRIGKLWAHQEVVNTLNKVKLPYNIPVQTQDIAKKAVSNKDLMKHKVKQILEQKEWLGRELEKLSIVNRVYPSDSNFYLVQFKNNPNYVYQELLNHNIVVRNFNNIPYHPSSAMRIAVGNNSQNQLLISTLQQLG